MEHSPRTRRRFKVWGRLSQLSSRFPATASGVVYTLTSHLNLWHIALLSSGILVLNHMHVQSLDCAQGFVHAETQAVQHNGNMAASLGLSLIPASRARQLKPSGSPRSARTSPQQAATASRTPLDGSPGPSRLSQGAPTAAGAVTPHRHSEAQGAGGERARVAPAERPHPFPERHEAIARKARILNISLSNREHGDGDSDGGEAGGAVAGSKGPCPPSEAQRRTGTTSARVGANLQVIFDAIHNGKLPRGDPLTRRYHRGCLHPVPSLHFGRTFALPF